MTRKTLAALLLLAAGQTAMANWQIVTLIDAVELSPSNMIMPASTNGLMTYRPCAGECDADYERALLTPNTVYSVKGKVVKFVDFQNEFAKARSSSDGYALLSVEVKTKTVTSIDISR